MEPLHKVPTGITGFDEITGGGLPAGRPTLVCGGAGCGKSLFSTEFLVRGALQFGEPGSEQGSSRKPGSGAASGGGTGIVLARVWSK